MAAVEITISGVLYDKYNRTQQNVVLIGEATLTGLSVGGGPIIPPGQPGGGGLHPSHPIALPGDPWWGDPHPAHPIVLPPNITPPDPPQNPSEPKPPPADGGWGWHPEYGWGYFPMQGGKPQPGPGKPA